MCDSRERKEEITLGPLTTEEIEKQKYFWTVHAQSSGKTSEKFEDDRLQLNLLERPGGLLECRGRIQEDYPIYLPDTHPTSGYSSRGSGSYDDKSAQGSLGAKTRRLEKKDNKELFWLQTIPGYCADKASPW